MATIPGAPSSSGELTGGTASDGYEDAGLIGIGMVLVKRLKLLIGGSLAAGLVALAATYAMTPTFTAKTAFIPPQAPQSAASTALGSLAVLAGATSQSGSPDRYIGLLQSDSVADRIIDQFDLQTVYDAEFRIQARNVLAGNVRFSVGKKDGLIRIEVDDTNPKRAADIANQYVTELRALTSSLALTEAQQRREFFDQQLRQTRDQLAQAQRNLEASGFNPGALKTDPRTAAEAYARLKAEVTTAEVRLQTMRTTLSDTAFEVIRQQQELAALRSQLARSERASGDSQDQDYISRYREFKYQETLFELYARQLEVARADESREGTLIQVVDLATVPEVKSRPKRAIIAIATTMATLVLLAALVVSRSFRRLPQRTPADSPL